MYQGVVDRRVAVGVVLLEHLADHTGALGVAAVVEHPFAEHGVEDAAMHRLEPIAHVWQGPADDDRHRIVEVRRPHLVLDVDERERVSKFRVRHGSGPPVSRQGRAAVAGSGAS
jgi:hypothetical protein